MGRAQSTSGEDRGDVRPERRSVGEGARGASGRGAERRVTDAQPSTRVALYTRVSTDEQAEKYGVDSQLRALRERAKARGWEVVDEFVDDGYSGATLERPQLTRLREAARLGAFDIVLVHSPDRLARDLMFSLLLEREMKQRGRGVEYVSISTDDSPAGNLQRQMLAAIAEFERHTIKERTQRGRREKALRGLLPGGPTPYGYRLDPAKPAGLVIDENEAAAVREMFAWVIDGESVRRITDRLNAQNLKPRRAGRWAKSSVRRMLTSPLYAGLAYYNRRLPGVHRDQFRPESEWIEIAVPAIIARAIFDRVQGQLARHRNVLGGGGRRLYLLKGLLVCGGRIHGIPMHGKRVYRCAGRDRQVAGDEGRCRLPVRAAEPVEAAVWEALERVLRDPDVLLAKVKASRQALDSCRVAAQTEVADLKRQLGRVDRQRERLLSLYLDESLNKAIYAERARHLDRQAEALARRLAAAEADAAAGSADTQRHDAALRYCKLVCRGLDRLDAAGRQRLLRLLVDRVVVHVRMIELHGLLPTEGAPLPTEGARASTVPADVQHRPQSEDVVAARRGHLEGALGVRLPADVGEVACRERRGGEQGGGIDAHRRQRRLPAEVADGLAERVDAEHRRPAGERRLGGVGAGHQQGAQAGGPRGRGDRQRAAHRVDAAVEAELAERAARAQVRQRRRARGGEDAERDREVEGGALLPDAGGAEVHGHAAGRIVEARVAQRRADAVARLAHRAVWEADGRGLRQPGRHVDLDIDDERVDAAQRPGADAGEHRSGLPGRVRSGNRWERNIAGDRRSFLTLTAGRDLGESQSPWILVSGWPPILGRSACDPWGFLPSVSRWLLWVFSRSGARAPGACSGRSTSTTAPPASRCRAGRRIPSWTKPPPVVARRSPSRSRCRAARRSHFPRSRRRPSAPTPRSSPSSAPRSISRQTSR